MFFRIYLFLAVFLSQPTYGTGYQTVGSSGCAVQMFFLPPNTTTAVFIDNYHGNYGVPGVDLNTGQIIHNIISL